MRKLKLLTLLSLLIPSLGFSFGVTWEGQLLDGGSPDVSNSRTINIKVFGLASCLIYEENHNGVDPGINGGYVSLTVGAGTPVGGTFNETIFDNTITPACTSGGPFVPGPYDDRKLSISVDGTPLTPMVAVSLLPAAAYANQAAIAQALDANAVVTASITDGSITDMKMSGIGANCANGDVLKTNGSGGFSCATDMGINTTNISTNTSNIATNVTDIGNNMTALTGKLNTTGGTITGALTIANGSQGAGKVLTSDAAGLATWTAPSGNALDVIAGGTVTGVVTFNNTASFGGTFNLIGGTAGQILTSDASGNGTWQAPLAYTGTAPITVTGTNIAITPGGIDNSLLGAGSVNSASIQDNSIAAADIISGTFLELVAGGSVTGATTFTSVLTTGDINSSTNISATGSFRSNSYCDNAGANCFDPSAGGMGDLKADGTTPMTGALSAILGTPAAPGYSFTGDNDTGIFSPAADNLSFATTAVERMVISPSGFIGIGTATPAQKLHIMDGPLLIEDSTVGTTAMAVLLEKSRAGAAVQMDDELGALEFKGHDGSAPVSAAYIEAQVDDSVSTGIVPGRLVFATRDIAGTMNTNMAIKSDGSIHAGAIMADINPPVAGFGCTFMSTANCQCNQGYTFIEQGTPNGAIDTDECVEPGLIVNTDEGVQANGFLTVGLEINYDSGQSGQCAQGFTWYDDDNSGTVDPGFGECVRYDFDAGDGHVSAFQSFNVGDDVEYGHPTGCTYDESTSCKCSPGHNHADMNQNGQLEAGECRWSIFSASTEHGVSISSFEDPAGPTCTGSAPPACNCQGGSFWKDINPSNGTMDNGECFKGGLNVDGQSQFNDGLYMKGGVFYRDAQNNDPAKGLNTEYNRARDNLGTKDPAVSGDVISTQRFKAYDGAQFREAANISVVVETGAMTSSAPGRIEFATGDGASAMAVAMTIQSDKTVHIKNMMKLEPQAAPPTTCDGGPSGPKDGLIAYNQSVGKLCVCNGTGWSGVAGAGCTGW